MAGVFALAPSLQPPKRTDGLDERGIKEFPILDVTYPFSLFSAQMDLVNLAQHDVEQRT